MAQREIKVTRSTPLKTVLERFGKFTSIRRYYIHRTYSACVTNALSSIAGVKPTHTDHLVRQHQIMRSRGKFSEDSPESLAHELGHASRMPKLLRKAGTPIGRTLQEKFTVHQGQYTLQDIERERSLGNKVMLIFMKPDIFGGGRTRHAIDALPVPDAPGVVVNAANNNDFYFIQNKAEHGFLFRKKK